jgi:hypothetical protein
VQCELAALLEEQAWLRRRTDEVAARIVVLDSDQDKAPGKSNRLLGSAIYMQGPAATVVLGGSPR